MNDVVKVPPHRRNVAFVVHVRFRSGSRRAGTRRAPRPGAAARFDIAEIRDFEALLVGPHLDRIARREARKLEELHARAPVDRRGRLEEIEERGGVDRLDGAPGPEDPDAFDLDEVRSRIVIEAERRPIERARGGEDLRDGMAAVMRETRLLDGHVRPLEDGDESGARVILRLARGRDGGADHLVRLRRRAGRKTGGAARGERGRDRRSRDERPRNLQSVRHASMPPFHQYPIAV